MPLLRFVVATLLLCACDKAIFAPLDSGPRPTGVQPPGRTSDLDDLDLEPRVIVLRDVSLSSEGMRGWDIDGRCTLAPEDGPAPDFECSPTNDSAAHVLDYPGCRDDAYGREVAGAFQPLGSGLEMALNDAAARGVGGLIVRITGWSGQSNDPEILLEVAPIAFGLPEGGVRGDALRWDGLDTFNTFEGAVRTADDAYVTDDRLVARFDDATPFVLRGDGSSLSLRLTDALLTAVLAEDLVTDVVLSGRWAVGDVIGELDSAGLCEGDPLRTAAEIRIRDAPDVRAIPRGGMGAGFPCEALSVSLGFLSYPALFGDVLEPSTAPPVACPVAP